MKTDAPRHALENKKALVVGTVNDQSIAYGWAKTSREIGAEWAITFLNDKAKPYVEPLADKLEAPIFMPFDAAKLLELEAVFERITSEWGQLDMQATPFGRRLTGQTMYVDGGVKKVRTLAILP